MKSVFIASNDKQAIHVIRDCFSENYNIQISSQSSSLLADFVQQRYEYCFIDVEFLLTYLKDQDYKKCLQAFWHVNPETEIIVMSPQSLIRDAVHYVKAGASNYLVYPIDVSEVKYLTESIRKDIKFQAELDYLRDRFWRRESFTILRTKSQLMKDVFEKVRAVAPTDSTVLITGETGTGKGIIAKLIHTHSQRSDQQFINIHCGAIPDTLLESELFGHEKGAFTGAIRRKLGKFEIAQGGTIFLDEIGTITASMQIKILQVLQEKTYQRVGGEVNIPADVRILVATNADLNQMCEDGLFRKDLYYRLNIFPIEIPPLRERKEDIPFLVETFLERLNKFSLKNIIGIDPDVMQALTKYHWPGNIRELENLIERAYILETSSMLTKKSFPIMLFDTQDKYDIQQISTSMTLDEFRRQEVERVEKAYLIALLKVHHGKIKNTAEAAGIGERQLHKLMTKYELRKETFKQP